MCCLPVGRFPMMNSAEAPLLPGRVCRHWRNITYSTPTLWSSIHIIIPLDYLCTRMPAYHDMRIQGATEWLSRTGSCPLSILISAVSYSSTSEVCASTADMYLDEVVFPFLSRCCSFHLSATDNSTWTSFFGRCSNFNFPLMKHIRLDIGAAYFYDNKVGKYLIDSPFFMSPELRTLSLPHYGPRTIQLPVQWNQLAVLNLYDNPTGWDPDKALSVLDALFLLSWCPCLTLCSISLSEMGPSYHVGSKEREPTMVSLLSMIGFRVLCDFDPKPFFLHLNIPSLRYFQHHQEAPPSSDALPNGENKALHLSLGPFIQRVVLPIEELQIDVSSLDAGDIVHCLELFPGLKRLSLLGYEKPFIFPQSNPGPMLTISSWILEQFMWKISHLEDNAFRSADHPGGIEERSSCNRPALCLCPMLEMLDIKGASFPDIVMLRFISFRMLESELHIHNGVSRLRWLNIRFCPGRNANSRTLKEVDDLRLRTGAHINLYYGNALDNYPRSDIRYSPYDGIVSSEDCDGPSGDMYLPLFSPVIPSGHI